MQYAMMILMCAESLYLLVTSLPLDSPTTGEVRETRNSFDQFGFPVEVEDKVVKEMPSNSCYVDISNTRMEKVPTAGLDSKNSGTAEAEEQFVTLETRKCCEGYTGTECNILIDPFLASNPCNNRTCPNDPDAQCAVISQCGSQTAVFLNALGQIVDCDEPSKNKVEDSAQHEPSAPSTVNVTDVSSISCQGFCEFDPCKGETCSPFPDAFCFQSGCDCQPVWILATGVQVDCASGTHLNPVQARSRRQAATGMLPSSCI